MHNIAAVFEHAVELYGNHTAIKHLSSSLTYRELNNRVNYFARHLKGRGVVPGDVVALFMSRSTEMIISMLAILKCGGAYLPLDTRNPKARNLLCLNEAKVKCIISDQDCSPLCENHRVNINTGDEYLFNSTLDQSMRCDIGEEEKAYIMFTSGSTGKPKGVVVPQRAVTRLVIDTNYIHITRSDNLFHFSPPTFDASTFEIWGALLNGATLVLYSGTVLDPNQLKRDLVDNDVSILWLTAALFHLVADRYPAALKKVRTLLAGGDVLNSTIINKVFEIYPDITIINGYGPTENTTFTCCHRMTVGNKPTGKVPIGKPITGTNVYVLDTDKKAVPPGEIGELYTGGRGVALGYLGETKNADGAFFMDEHLCSGLIYRTGDLVREDTDGQLEFIGRSDSQVKIRGYRVSLDEVRAHLLNVKSIREAIVELQEGDAGDQLLVAHIKLQNGVDCKASELRKNLLDVLPQYMVPDKLLVNESLPINNNGKVMKHLIS